jgi:hypothetical protein
MTDGEISADICNLVWPDEQRTVVSNDDKPCDDFGNPHRDPARNDRDLDRIIGVLYYKRLLLEEEYNAMLKTLFPARKHTLRQKCEALIICMRMLGGKHDRCGTYAGVVDGHRRYRKERTIH